MKIKTLITATVMILLCIIVVCIATHFNLRDYRSIVEQVEHQQPEEQVVVPYVSSPKEKRIEGIKSDVDLVEPESKVSQYNTNRVQYFTKGDYSEGLYKYITQGNEGYTALVESAIGTPILIDMAYYNDDYSIGASLSLNNKDDRYTIELYAAQLIARMDEEELFLFDNNIFDDWDGATWDEANEFAQNNNGSEPDQITGGHVVLKKGVEYKKSKELIELEKVNDSEMPFLTRGAVVGFYSYHEGWEDDGKK